LKFESSTPISDFFDDKYYLSLNKFYGLNCFAQKRKATVVDLVERKTGICLDIGCGTGEYFDELRKKGYHIVAMDSSKIAIQISKARAFSEGNKSRIDLVLCSADALPFKKWIFDFVLMTQVFHYLRNPLKTLFDVSAVAKFEGSFLITAANSACLLMALGRIEGIFYRKERGQKGFHFKEYSSWQLLGMMKRSRFKIVRILGFDIIPQVPRVLKDAKKGETVNLLLAIEKKFRHLFPFNYIGRMTIIVAKNCVTVRPGNGAISDHKWRTKVLGLITSISSLFTHLTLRDCVKTNFNFRKLLSLCRCSRTSGRVFTYKTQFLKPNLSFHTL
jgi:ubiquinone/menaquinone biosynthesis C-methylase UbiE